MFLLAFLRTEVEIVHHPNITEYDHFPPGNFTWQQTKYQIMFTPETEENWEIVDKLVERLEKDPYKKMVFKDRESTS